MLLRAEYSFSKKVGISNSSLCPIILFFYSALLGFESLVVFFVVLISHWLREIIERDVFGLFLLNSELVEIVALNCSPLHYTRDNVIRKRSCLLQELD